MLPMTLVSFKVKSTRFVSFKKKDSGMRPVRSHTVLMESSLRFVSEAIVLGSGPANELGPSLSDSNDEAREIELEIGPPKSFEPR